MPIGPDIAEKIREISAQAEDLNQRLEAAALEIKKLQHDHASVLTVTRLLMAELDEQTPSGKKK